MTIFTEGKQRLNRHKNPLKFNHFLSLHGKLVYFLLIFFIFSGYSARSQVLNDSNSIRLIKKGIDYVYDFQFTNATKVGSELKRLYPEHPINNLFRGLITYWENYPLISTSEARESFVSDMRRCIEICDKNKNSSNEAELLLLNLCARGLLLLYYTDNDLSFEVFPIASSTYQCIRKSFSFTARYIDLYFFTGIYNYYREAYPDAHPVYKTLAFLFPKGSKVKGLADLQIVSEKSILMKAESYTFLTDIFMYFENNLQRATYYSKSLHSIYPYNPRYLGTYIKNLLLMKKYDEAEKEIETSGSIKNDFFQAQILIFKGILQEKKYHNLEKAEEYYNKGIRNISVFRNFGNEYSAYAYFGLSRISDVNGDAANKKSYRKLAVKLAEFRDYDFDD